MGAIVIVIGVLLFLGHRAHRGASRVADSWQESRTRTIFPVVLILVLIAFAAMAGQL